LFAPDPTRSPFAVAKPEGFQKLREFLLFLVIASTIGIFIIVIHYDFYFITHSYYLYYCLLPE